ncbi:hypothetical protein SERLA73DRAFT_179641, partial [Serpula lacrymans var. lacrymans S7.3]
FPCAESSKTSKPSEAKDGIDFKTGTLRPSLVQHCVGDVSKTVEQVGERGKREKSKNKSTTGDTSSDDDGSYW